jgi:molecular chaperone GrpE (heat shock protein)
VGELSGGGHDGLPETPSEGHGDVASAEPGDASENLMSFAADGVERDIRPQTGNAVNDGPDLSEILTVVRTIEQQTRAFHSRAENYESIIQQMQNRIEELQRDQRFAALHTHAADATEQAHARSENAAKDLGFFAVAIEEALGLVDIESVGAAADVAFDSRRHHAARVVPTADPNLDRRVHRVLRQGFAYVGASRVLLPAQVSIYRYEPPPAETAVDEEPRRSAAPGEGDADD